jgi:frataxin
MDESFYHKVADAALAKLLDFAEKLEESYDIEVEIDSGVLTITLPSKRQYVINKHTPSRQIWVSSPQSGAGYFEFKDNQWLPKRINEGSANTLFDFISAEINHILQPAS